MLTIFTRAISSVSPLPGSSTRRPWPTTTFTPPMISSWVSEMRFWVDRIWLTAIFFAHSPRTFGRQDRLHLWLTASRYLLLPEHCTSGRFSLSYQMIFFKECQFNHCSGKSSTPSTGRSLRIRPSNFPLACTCTSAIKHFPFTIPNRKLAAARGIDLDVYTGTYGRCKLADESGVLHDIYLYPNGTSGAQIPVPALYYRILVNDADDSGIVLIGNGNNLR
jgi:hypothetical protein